MVNLKKKTSTIKDEKIFVQLQQHMANIPEAKIITDCPYLLYHCPTPGSTAHRTFYNTMLLEWYNTVAHVTRVKIYHILLKYIIGKQSLLLKFFSQLAFSVQMVLSISGIKQIIQWKKSRGK